MIGDYRVLLSGKATFTLEFRDERYTYRVNRFEPEGGGDPMFFVNLLTGQDNEADYTYLGMLQPRSGQFRTTNKSRMPADSKPCRGFSWVAGKMFAGLQADQMPNGVMVKWSERCQRCGRTLTVPSSIDARLGPECATKV